MSISKKLNGVNYNSLLKTHGVVRSITSLKNNKKKKREENSLYRGIMTWHYNILRQSLANKVQCKHFICVSLWLYYLFQASELTRTLYGPLIDCFQLSLWCCFSKLWSPMLLKEQKQSAKFTRCIFEKKNNREDSFFLVTMEFVKGFIYPKSRAF